MVGELVGASPDLPYEDQLKRLVQSKIALWDVCAAAVRKGSLNSHIRLPVPNDFVSFSEHTKTWS